MNISDKIIRAKADLDYVYEAGVEKGRSEATDGVIVESLEVAANGTYTAPNGVAYSPVKVNVPDVNGSYDEGYEDGYEKGKASGGGGLTPSEGLEFTETYVPALYVGYYGWSGKGTCTDTEIVVPCATPAGHPVISVGYVTDQRSSMGIWCEGISKIYLPDTVTEIPFSGLLYGDILKYIKFGRYFQSVGEYMYADGMSPPTDVVLDFSDYARSTPPTLADTSLFRGVIAVRVPLAMVDTFKTATNWSVAADRIVGV